MCGRVGQHRGAVEYGSMLKIKFPKGPPNAPAHYNGAPGQDYLIARSDPRTHDTTLDLSRWGAPSVLGQGPENGLEDDQRPSRVGGDSSGVQEGFRKTALLSAR
jgi:putative SOS response-associated peptidase YedK